MTAILRDYQEVGIANLRTSIAAGYKRPLLQLPTGAGKTKIAAAIINSALAKGKRVIFTVPAIALIDQTVREFWSEGIRDIGVIQASHQMTDPTRSVQVCSVQTLQRRPIPPADLVIVDEAHLMFAFVTDWMGQEEWAGVPFIGLSATPWPKGLGRLYDKLVVVTTIRELIARGFLSPFKVFAPTHPDMSKVRTVAGDYRDDDSSKVMRHLVADVVNTWLEKAEGRSTLCFCVDRNHAMDVHTKFQAAGVPSAYMDAHTPPLDREQIRQQFQAGQIKVVCNVGVLTTGVDWDVRCISLCRPTKSIILYVQIVGRGLRPVYAAGFDPRQPCSDEERKAAIDSGPKPFCLILDHSDTTLRLGFVTDIQRELDDGTMASAAEKREMETTDKPEPRECPQCKVLRQGWGPCPNCGFKQSKPSKVETKDGELTELDQRRENKADWIAKQSFIAQLRAYATMKGKGENWVSAKYRSKFGVWPNDPRVKYQAPAKSVDAETRSWITASNIRYAAGKKKAQMNA